MIWTHNMKINTFHLGIYALFLVWSTSMAIILYFYIGQFFNIIVILLIIAFGIYVHRYPPIYTKDSIIISHKDKKKFKIISSLNVIRSEDIYDVDILTPFQKFILANFGTCNVECHSITSEAIGLCTRKGAYIFDTELLPDNFIKDNIPDVDEFSKTQLVKSSLSILPVILFPLALSYSALTNLISAGFALTSIILFGFAINYYVYFIGASNFKLIKNAHELRGINIITGIKYQNKYIITHKLALSLDFIFKKYILLNSIVTQYDKNIAEYLLFHELGHIKRYHALIHTIFYPVVFLLMTFYELNLVRSGYPVYMAISMFIIILIFRPYFEYSADKFSYQMIGFKKVVDAIVGLCESGYTYNKTNFKYIDILKEYLVAVFTGGMSCNFRIWLIRQLKRSEPKGYEAEVKEVRRSG